MIGKNPKIEVRVQKFFRKGRGYVRVLGFTLLGKEDLPDDYVNGWPVAYKDNGAIIMFTKDGSYITVSCGDEIHEDRWNLICETLAQSGERLTKIMKEIRKIEPRWNKGDEVFVYQW